MMKAIKLSQLSKLLDRPIVRSGQKFDVSLVWMIVLMTSFSLLMIYSASVVTAAAENGNPYEFAIKQAMFVGLSLMICSVLRFVKMQTWKRLTPFIFFGCVFLLWLVLGVGRNINGATRWIHVGPVNLQPSELFKLAAVLYLASFFTRRIEVLQALSKLNFAYFLKRRAAVWQALRRADIFYFLKNGKVFLGIALPMMMLSFLGLMPIMLQPDFGSTVVILVIMTSLLFLAGFPLLYFSIALIFVLGAIIGAIITEPYRMARVTGFLDPWVDPWGKGYQLTHSLMAIGRGGWFGEGLGASLEKRFYLPEAHTDFIFAVIGEEFGFLGMLLLVAGYVWIVMRAISIGKQARDLDLVFSAYVAYGIGVWLGIQSFFNIGVNMGILPTKGLPLPLMSYGGSSVLVMMICMMLLLRIDYENRQKMRGYQIEG